MGIIRNLLNLKAFTASLALLLSASSAFGITQYKKEVFQFIYNPTKMRASISVSSQDSLEKLSIPEKVLRIRTKRSAKDARIEPLKIKVPASPKEMAALAKKIAKKKKASALYDYFSKNYRLSTEPVRSDNTKKLVISPKAFSLMNPKKLSRQFQRDHHKVFIESSPFKTNRKLRKQLLKQVGPFLSKEERRRLGSKIRLNERFNLEKDLLPSFAKKMIRKYLVFKGPNCFHASLAFHGKNISKSPFINVKAEKGYHRAMINYDELWRAINRHFYEVNISESALKYGDMLVFFEIPPDSSDKTYFRWIRHAATYLIGPYTFSKGSKSPDTPYSIKTMDEEWKTWKKYTKNLGVKVFRRTTKNVTKRPPQDLVDWIY